MCKFDLEVVAVVGDIKFQVENLLKKCLENIHDEKTGKGLLRHSYAQYAGCLQVDFRKFKMLIDADIEEWKTDLEVLQAWTQTMKARADR